MRRVFGLAVVLLALALPGQAQTINYTQTDTDASNDCIPSSSADFEKNMVDGGTAGSTEMSAEASGTGYFLYLWATLDGNEDGAAGTWTIRFNVTTAEMNGIMDRVSILHLDSACSLKTTVRSLGEPTGGTIDCSTTGVKTFTESGAALNDVAAGDLIRVLLRFTSSSHSATIGITPSEDIDSPLSHDAGCPCSYDGAITVTSNVGETFLARAGFESALTAAATNGYTPAPSTSIPVAAAYDATGGTASDGFRGIPGAISAGATGGYATAILVAFNPALSLANTTAPSWATQGDLVGVFDLPATSSYSAAGNADFLSAASADVTGAVATAGGLAFNAAMSAIADVDQSFAGSADFPVAASFAATGGTTLDGSRAIPVAMAIASVGGYNTSAAADFLSAWSADVTGGLLTNGGSDFSEAMSAAVSSGYSPATFVGAAASFSAAASAGYSLATQLNAVGSFAAAVNGAFTPAALADLAADLSVSGTTGLLTNGGSDFSESFTLANTSTVSPTTFVGHAPSVAASISTESAMDALLDAVGVFALASTTDAAVAPSTAIPAVFSADVVSGYSTLGGSDFSEAVSMSLLSGFALDTQAFLGGTIALGNTTNAAPTANLDALATGTFAVVLGFDNPTDGYQPGGAPGVVRPRSRTLIVRLPGVMLPGVRRSF